MSSPTVFLSYAREDRASAATIAGALQAAGLEVWWDERLRGGDEFSTEIEAKLRSAHCVVVLWTPTSVTSMWVRAEAQIGAERGVLVPVACDGATPPLPFNGLQTLDVTEWLKGSHEELRDAFIASIASRMSVSPPVPLGDQRTRVDELRTLLLIGSPRDIRAGFHELEAHVKRHAGDRDAWQLLEQYRRAVAALVEVDRPSPGSLPAPSRRRRGSLVEWFVIGSLLLLVGVVGWVVFRFGVVRSVIVAIGVLFGAAAVAFAAMLIRGWMFDRRLRRGKGQV
jgi:hypothetical protein